MAYNFQCVRFLYFDYSAITKVIQTLTFMYTQLLVKLVIITEFSFDS
jgi:hypothetical protein